MSAPTPLLRMNSETSPAVLLIEDDEAMARILRHELEADGYAVTHCDTLGEAERRLPSLFPDVVVVDVGLPDGSGLDVLRAVRGAGAEGAGVDPDLPVMVLSGRCSESDRVRAFEHGADDFVAKPFSYRELRGRLAALLRRRERSSAQGRIRVGRLVVDPARWEVTVGDRPVLLTQKEFVLLHALASEPERVFSKGDLLSAVWGYRAAGQTRTRTLDSHACRLRAKLAAAGGEGLVENVWGVGYRLTDTVSRSYA